MKSKKVNFKILFIIVIAIILTLIIYICLGKVGILQKLNETIKPETPELFSYIIYDNQDEKNIKMLIEVNDEKGIEYIKESDGKTINCNGKTQVSLEYVAAKNSNLSFTVKTNGEQEISKNITLNDETISNNSVSISKIKDIEGYKIFEIKNNLSLIADRFKTYYKIGENGDWVEGKGKISTLDYDLTQNGKVNEEDNTVTIYAKIVNEIDKDDKLEDVVTISQKYEVNTDSTQSSLEADSLIDAVEKYNFDDGEYSVKVAEETYNLKVQTFNQNLEIDANTEIGSENDVATENENAKSMVVLKVNGDLTINEEAKLTAYASKNGYGGPKGMMIYCTGTLTNNGTISMTARGAKAEGQNVYLWKNSDNSYEFVPAVGASGASRAIISASGFWGGRFSTAGISGNNSINRQTAGGGSGAAICHGDSGRYTSISGAGTNGTSYSGGTGGGAALGDINYSSYTAEAGTINGGKGGKSKSNYLGNAGSGAGNPGGTDGNVGSKGSNGTGGLLIIYANNIINNSIIESNGSNGGTGYWNAGGGSSGGGSINIFYKDNYTENNGSITADGGIAMCATGYKGGAGGTGSISVGQILNGTYTSTYTNY